MKQIEKAVYNFLRERGWDNLRPSDLAKSVSIEAGELLELFQWSNDDLENVKNDPEQVEKIKKELADVLIYALDIAVLLKIDTQEIILKKLEHAAKKYPPEIFKKRKNGQDPGTEKKYWQVKQDYRKRGL